ncbi:MAG TPA: DUF4912 domain-containing protein [Polyangiaceae bacterium]|nr:DUF4912 domain-containing protein [Polyangiaceae bacterium]
MPNEGLVLDNPVLRIEKGRVSPPSEDEEEPRGSHDEHIPWGYGKDRLTAMPVDPNRLYLYWELTDPGVEKARQSLGTGAKDAWVSLRIYDVTDRIFDGTNAHGYFDIKVDRSDRQWFVHVGKPASTHVAEIGLKSLEGYFVKVVRSGRIEFPRFEPSSDGTVEWLTVRTATGPVEGASPGGSSSNPAPSGAVPPTGQPGGGQLEANGAVASAGAPIELYDWSQTGWEELFQTTWQELFRTRWREGQAVLDWSTPVLRSSWEAGPFDVPVEAPHVTEEFHHGPVTVIPTANGKTRVVYGPWQVVMRGLGGHAEKRVLARWEVAASWVVEMGVERVLHVLSPSNLRDHAERGADGGPNTVGSSALFGASERRWLAASEMRLGGASEVYFAGASELRWRGASEVLAGSERRLLGASERLWLGGSEKVWLGASERRLGDASDDGFAFAIDDGLVKLGGR